MNEYYNNKNNNMYNNKYLHNIHKICIIKVQGGAKNYIKNVNGITINDLQQIENKTNDFKLTASWLYESYLRNTK